MIEPSYPVEVQASIHGNHVSVLVTCDYYGEHFSHTIERDVVNRQNVTLILTSSISLAVDRICRKIERLHEGC